MLHIYIDGDGCAVKDEVYKVADRYQLQVTVVANKPMNTPTNARTKMVVVRQRHLDAADDWIVKNVTANDIVVTADIPLADRCIKLGARVLGPRGEEFTEDNVGSAIAMRELMKDLRERGEAKGGTAPIQKQDKSKFLGKLDQIIQSLLKLRD